MAPDPHTVARAADGPWNLDASPPGSPSSAAGVARRDRLDGRRAVGRWRRRPRTAPERLVAEIAELLAKRPGLRVRPDVPEPRWRWPVAPWSDLDALALGLDLRVGELDWFADPGGWLTRAPEGPLHHYRRRWTTSRAGAPRLLESPAPRLQELQRRVGRKVLAAIPVHDAAHGYVRGRSPHTLAAAHAGTPLVVRLDLEGFFAHVTGERVAGLLRTAGYPAAVAAALAGLLVTTTPRAVLRGARPPWRQRGGSRGAGSSTGSPPRTCRRARRPRPSRPTSSPTASTGGWPASLLRSVRTTGATPTTWCSPGRRCPPRARRPGHDDRGGGGLPGAAGQDARAARPPSSGRTGLVVNTRPAVARREYDALRALLHKCAHGPAAQNHDAHPAFREHLLGRIAGVERAARPARGAPARALRGILTRRGASNVLRGGRYLRLEPPESLAPPNPS